MELYQIGSHCAESGCNQLDFLPFNCSFCSRTFCKDHRLTSSHSHCTGLKDQRGVECPLCLQPVNGASTALKDNNISLLNSLVEQHIQQGCPSTTHGTGGTSTSSSPSSSSASSRVKCQVKRCTKQINPRIKGSHFVCKSCGGGFCVSHRHEMDHNCSTMNVPKKHHQQQQQQLHQQIVPSSSGNSKQSHTSNRNQATPSWMKFFGF